MDLNKALDAPIITLKGVGKKTADKLADIGLINLRDLLFYFPFRYQDRSTIRAFSELIAEQENLICGRVVYHNVLYGRKKSLICQLVDEQGDEISLRFFHFSAYQLQQLSVGQELLCFGLVKYGRAGFEMMHPEYSLIDKQPAQSALEYRAIYHASDGISQQLLRNLIFQVLVIFEALSIEEVLAQQVMDKYHFPSFQQAIKFLHQPSIEFSLSDIQANKTVYHQRLIFEELLAHQLQLLVGQQVLANFDAAFKLKNQTNSLIANFVQALPFELTLAQKKVYQQIKQDLTRLVPMHRLLQGDVGSGKTVVAALTILLAIESGCQTCLMVPTEMLAEQHMLNFKGWFQALNLNIVCLTSKIKNNQRREMLAKIVSGEVDLVIGTHALFQQDVDFYALGLIVIDEQHRFGVQQRLLLKNKGLESRALSNKVPHILVMTATPIPRTLTMTAYADLSCSIIDGMPQGRKSIKTVMISEQRRNEIINRVYQACMQGQQAYWVCTLIDESEQLQCQAAEQTYQNLRHLLEKINVGLVHGKMPVEQKQEVMARFVRGELQLLIATTVIEVGVDVPNASLMIIENAERLGLAQLHQLRGRVGRGEKQSSCVLLYGAAMSSVGKKRLEIIRASNDGFKIAEQDLQIRGPGELLGTRQTGYAQLYIADIERDKNWHQYVHQCGKSMIENNIVDGQLLCERWMNKNEHYKCV